MVIRLQKTNGWEYEKTGTVPGMRFALTRWRSKVDSNCRSRWFLIEIAGSLPVSFSPSALARANGEKRNG
jgi:hypothetical protein